MRFGCHGRLPDKLEWMCAFLRPALRRTAWGGDGSGVRASSFHVIATLLSAPARPGRGRSDMPGQSLQIIARGPRAAAEAAAAAIDADPALESATYSILEEDEARGAWRLDLFPTSDAEAGALLQVLEALGGLRVVAEPLADADWLALALSGLPPVRAGRFFVYGAHDAGRVPTNAIGLRIEAGAAFGTGHHGTTVGCLAALDALLKARGFLRVLDV